MQANFPDALARVLDFEGGFVNDPHDPGGATNKGITIAVFRKWVKRNGTVEDLKNISPQDVAKVYRKHYWDAVRADDLPHGVDFAVFDYAVNSGPTRAAKALQAACNVTQDGIIGHVTLAALSHIDPKEIVQRVCNARLAFLRTLKTWERYKGGWQRRVLDVRVEASAMALRKPVAPKEPAQATPQPPKPVSRPEPAPARKLTLWEWLCALFRRTA